MNTKIAQAHTIIQQAAADWPAHRLAIAWTGGKDSTVMLHLIRHLYPTIPFPILFNDSTMEFPAVYRFINQLKKDWQLNIITIKPTKTELAKIKAAPTVAAKSTIFRQTKITAINRAIKQYRLQAIFTGIRRDEHPARANETAFSPRPNHTRIHPLLDFTLSDIWQYIHLYNVPYVSLYDQGYKSLGAAPFTQPVEPGAPERAGREPAKEKVMQRLRNLGYW